MAKTKTPSKKTTTTRKSGVLKQTPELTAKNFITRLKTYQSDVELEKIKRYFKSEEGDYGAGDIFMGVRMGNVFSLAKEFIDMAPGELERLLESENAVSILWGHSKCQYFDSGKSLAICLNQSIVRGILIRSTHILFTRETSSQ